MVHLVAIHRRDGENERRIFKTKNHATCLLMLVSIVRGMDELRFMHKSKVPKVT